MVQRKHFEELKLKKDWHKETLAERMEKERKRVAAEEEVKNGVTSMAMSPFFLIPLLRKLVHSFSLA